MVYVGDSAPEKLSPKRAEPLVSYVGDGLQGAPGNACYALPGNSLFFKANRRRSDGIVRCHSGLLPRHNVQTAHGLDGHHRVPSSWLRSSGRSRRPRCLRPLRCRGCRAA